MGKGCIQIYLYFEKDILEYCEQQDLNLNAKKKKELTSAKLWKKHLTLWEAANSLMQSIGTDEYRDFNAFSKMVDQEGKAQKLKLSPAEKNYIMNAISWYDENAEKVIKKKHKN